MQISLLIFWRWWLSRIFTKSHTLREIHTGKRFAKIWLSKSSEWIYNKKIHSCCFLLNFAVFFQRKKINQTNKCYNVIECILSCSLGNDGDANGDSDDGDGDDVDKVQHDMHCISTVGAAKSVFLSTGGHHIQAHRHLCQYHHHHYHDRNYRHYDHYHNHHQPVSASF